MRDYRLGPHAIVSALAMLMVAGCSANGVNGYGSAEPEEYRSFAQEELAALIEQGLQEQLPPPPSKEALELYALKLGDAYRAGKRALALRKKNKRADELVGLMQELRGQNARPGYS